MFRFYINTGWDLEVRVVKKENFDVAVDFLNRKGMTFKYKEIYK